MPFYSWFIQIKIKEGPPLHLVDMSLKSLLIYNFPPPLFLLLLICQWNWGLQTFLHTGSGQLHLARFCSTGSCVLCISCNVIGAFRDIIKHRFGFLQDDFSSGAVYFLLHHLHIVSLSEILGLLKWIQVLSAWSSRYNVLLSPFHRTVLATTDDHWTKSIISLQASKWCFSKSV